MGQSPLLHFSISGLTLTVPESRPVSYTRPCITFLIPRVHSEFERELLVPLFPLHGVLPALITPLHG
jgi:hypothetical protein